MRARIVTTVTHYATALIERGEYARAQELCAEPSLQDFVGSQLLPRGMRAITDSNRARASLPHSAC